MKRIIKYISYAICVVLLYFVLAIVCSYIPIRGVADSCAKNETIFLTTNGIHLDVILSSRDVPLLFQEKLPIGAKSRYLAIGWGEKDFYLNVKEWSDLTIGAAFSASLGLNDSLLHLISYERKQSDWVQIKICKHQLETLQKYIAKSLYLDENNGVKSYPAYGKHDAFYKAYGRYTCVNTCNTWVNSAFKEMRLTASLWTPFDFGLLHHYE